MDSNAEQRAASESGTIRPHLGPLDVAFFVIAAAAPLGATVGVAPVVYGAAGFSVAYLFAFAALALLLFSVGFAYSCRVSKGSGGFAELIALGLGRPVGDMAAGVSLLAYCAMLAGVVGQIAPMIPVPCCALAGRGWLMTALIVLSVVAFLGYRRIDVSRRFMAVAITLELLALLVLDASLFLSGTNGRSGVPAPVFPDLGAPGTAVGLMFAIACFVGFESTALYGEEARDPMRTLPKATYLAIGTIGIFYGLTMWCLGVAYRNHQLQHLIADDPGAFVPGAALAYLGPNGAAVIRFLSIGSLVAVLISFQNALARYIHQLAGTGLLPRRLHKVHPAYGSPHVASSAVSLVTLAIVLGFGVAGGDPVLQLYAWLVGLGTLCIVLVQALCAISITTYIARSKGPLSIAIATMVGGAGLSVAFALCAINFDMLSGGGNATKFLPALILIAGLGALGLRQRQ